MITIPPDKALHFGAGSIAAAAGAITAPHLGIAPALGAAIATSLAALAREAWNHQRGGPFDWRDIAATMLGAAPVMAAAAV